MSLILDALKKLDRERSFRRSGVRDIAMEILRSDASRRRRSAAFWGAAIVIIVFAAAVSYILIWNPDFLAKSPPPAPAKVAREEAPRPLSESPAKPVLTPAAAPIQKRAPAPAPPASNPPGSAASKSVPVEPPNPEQKIPATVARDKPQAPVQPGSLGAAQPAPRAEEKPALSPRPEQKPAVRTQPERPAVSPPSAAVSAPPQKPAAAPASRESAPGQIRLKISGIVWHHDDPAERKVVINGMFLTEGAVYEGMKVLEIQPDRVRLLRDGKPFELAIFP